MADVKTLINGLNQKLNHLNQKIGNFFRFIGRKLRNFKNLTLGEQISYSSVGAGLLLILVSVVLFIL